MNIDIGVKCKRGGNALHILTHPANIPQRGGRQCAHQSAQGYSFTRERERTHKRSEEEEMLCGGELRRRPQRDLSLVELSVYIADCVDEKPSAVLPCSCMFLFICAWIAREGKGRSAGFGRVTFCMECWGTSAIQKILLFDKLD